MCDKEDSGSFIFRICIECCMEGDVMWKRYLKAGIIIACFCFILVVGLRQNNANNTGILYEQQITFVPEKKEVSDAVEEVAEDELQLLFNPLVRVVLFDSSMRGMFHDRVLITSDEDYELKGSDGTLYATYQGGITIDLSDYNMMNGQSLIVKSPTGARFSIDSLTRSQGVPFYRGTLQIYKEEEGFVIVNEVLLEEYLLTVVPSEMPSSYPADALAAQAVCARSYAYSFLAEPGYPQYGAHMDDTTSYQVYNNIKETEATTQAVADTQGCIMLYEGRPTPTFFFSTSCGMTTIEKIWSFKFTNEEALYKPVCVNDLTKDTVETMSTDTKIYSADALCDNEVFASYITDKDPNALEADEQWYRWRYEGKLNAEQLYQKLCDIYAERPEAVLAEKDGEYLSLKPQEFSSVKRISIEKRLPGGVADELLIVTDRTTYKIISEYYIRMVLASGQGTVIRNDGTEVKDMSLLPSAYFIIEEKKNSKGNVTGMTLQGGGYGHGVGMSQNGAKCAALEGMEWKEILELFYGNFEILQIEE